MLTLPTIVSLLYGQFYSVIFCIQDSQGNPSGGSNLLQSWKCEGPHYFEEDIPEKQHLTLTTLQDGRNDCKVDSGFSPY